MGNPKPNVSFASEVRSGVAMRFIDTNAIMNSQVLIDSNLASQNVIPGLIISWRRTSGHPSSCLFPRSS